MNYKFPLALTALLLIAGLGACSQEAEVPARGDNYVDNPTEPATEPTPTAPKPQPPEPDPTPSAASNMTAALPDKAPPPAPDEQLLDDASATGMTARTTRGDQTNQAASVERSETN